ncbi:hypothetical protein N5A93_17440 [Roseovarius sp. EGI FJ00037]|uniref:hypothetical protein n=1 Tax=Roseovarius salincola TaxID=2978479 RepID=UPI0022A8BD9B|nr:hypothetical protein [Roseovarius sp. EGI FJ00037]MCZ0814007.1 hypothetical protein [Roseovarius sp. EGI FJ00037]
MATKANRDQEPRNNGGDEMQNPARDLFDGQSRYFAWHEKVGPELAHQRQEDRRKEDHRRARFDPLDRKTRISLADIGNNTPPAAESSAIKRLRGVAF